MSETNLPKKIYIGPQIDGAAGRFEDMGAAFAREIAGEQADSARRGATETPSSAERYDISKPAAVVGAGASAMAGAVEPPAGMAEPVNESSERQTFTQSRWAKIRDAFRGSTPAHQILAEAGILLPKRAKLYDAGIATAAAVHTTASKALEVLGVPVSGAANIRQARVAAGTANPLIAKGLHQLRAQGRGVDGGNNPVEGHLTNTIRHHNGGPQASRDNRGNLRDALEADLDSAGRRLERSQRMEQLRSDPNLRAQAQALGGIVLGAAPGLVSVAAHVV